MYISKEKLRELVKNSPQGTTPERLLSALVSRGYTIEGYNEKENFSQDVIKGVGKSAVKTFTNISSLGERGLQFLTGGIKKDPTSAQQLIPERLRTYQTKGEKFGGFIGDVAQFAIPGTKVTKATQGLNLLSKIGTRALTSGAVATAQEGKVGSDTAIATGAEIALPGVSKVANVPIKIFSRLMSGLGSALSGVARSSLKQIADNPKTALAVSNQIKKLGQEGVLEKNARVILDGVSDIRKDARKMYGRGLEKLGTKDIKVSVIRDNLKGVLGKNKIKVSEGKFNFSDSEIFDKKLQDKAANLLKEVNNFTSTNGKRLKLFMDKLEVSRFKSSLDPDRQAFNSLLDDVRKGLKNSVNQSTNKLKDINLKYSSAMDLAGSIEKIFGKVKFKNTSELNQVAKKLDNLVNLKGLDNKTITNFLNKIGASDDVFRTSEATRSVYLKDVPANTMGINIREAVQQITASVVTPKMVKDIAIATGLTSNVIKSIIKYTSPTGRAAIIKALININE